MCFELGSCFGNGRRQDYGRERPTPRGGSTRENNGNGYWSAPAPVYQYQTPAGTVQEAGHKAYHDGADGGLQGANAANVQDKADDKTPKLPAWHNKVGDDAGYGAYTPAPFEAVADHRSKDVMDYHGYPTTLVRY